MKKTLFLMAILVFAGTASLYAGGHHAKTAEEIEEYVEYKVKKMTKALDLNENQMKSYEKIIRMKVEKKEAIKANARNAKDALSKQYKSQVSAILDTDQKAEFTEMWNEWMEKKNKKKKRFFFF